jgi:serine/threonine protein kinase
MIINPRAKKELYKCRKCGKLSLQFDSVSRLYKCLRPSCGYECTRAEFFYPNRSKPEPKTDREAIASKQNYFVERSVTPRAVLLNNRYEVQRQLKIGGMAVIRLARDTQTNSLCVIKSPRTDTKHDPKINIDKLVMETAYLMQFNHPNIIKYLDMFTHDNVLHLVVEYVDGDDLLTAFAAKPADEAQTIKWGNQILDALEYIHRSGVVHRDLNPGNIMLRRDGSVVIIDFGTLKPAAADGGTVVSKPGFEVPEQVARGYSDVRSDLCALGGVLFYLLTCAPPGYVGNSNVVDLLATKGVSTNTAKCIEQAIRIKPDDRFQSASSMRKALGI